MSNLSILSKSDEKNFQYSIFSSGNSTVALSIAYALKSLGHIPVLINLNGTSEWFEDVTELKDTYEKRNLCEFNSAEPLDLYIDIVQLCLFLLRLFRGND